MSHPMDNFNYPINAYPAGSYGYSVTPANGAVSRAGDTTVNYPAGLGTSVSANFKGSGSTVVLGETVSGTGSLS